MFPKSYKRKLLPWIYLNFIKHANAGETLPDPSQLLKTVYRQLDSCVECPNTNLEYIWKTHGFSVGIQESDVHNRGVFVTQGSASQGSVVAYYPGTVYHPGDSIFIQSISNSYIFQCSDGIFIDGKHCGISGKFYKSCSERNRLGPYLTCDQSWLALKNLANPLACGQIVNNGGIKNSNVSYCEIDVDLRLIPLKQRKFVPNVLHSDPSPYLRMVVLVATKDISEGEEVLSSYFSVY
jgi:hypothetical protein